MLGSLLEPVFHGQAAHMIEMPDVASCQDQVVSLGGGGNQTVPVADRRAQRFPLRPKIAGEDGRRWAEGQYRKVRQHVRLHPLPQLVAGRSDSGAETDFLEADDRGEQGFRLGLEPGLDTRIREATNQLAENVGIQQIHDSVEGGRRRAGHDVPFRFNSLQNLEEGIVVRDAIGIEVGAIGQTLELAPLGTRSGCPRSGQSGTNSTLLLLREAFDQFDDVQRRRAHG